MQIASHKLVKFALMTSYYYLDEFVHHVSDQYDLRGKKLLDIGAETKRHKQYFKNLTYLSHDIEQDARTSYDYTGDLNKKLTAKAKSMDYILCIQVLEHVKDPANAFREFHRILKPGGKLFLTTNFIYPIHMEPNDYYRFTQYGLQYLGESSGFEIEHIKPHGGVFHFISYTIVTLPIRLFMQQAPKTALVYLAVCSPVIAVLNLCAYVLDMLDREKRITINYEVIYRKKN